MGEAEDCNELLAAQSHLYNHIFCFINSMALKCAVQLAIPDIIQKHGHPMTLHQLVHSLNINHAKSKFIHRLMRVLIHSGYFRTEKIRGGENEAEEEGYVLTAPSKLLTKDHPLSLAPYVVAMLDPTHINPWQTCSEWFQSGDATTFVTYYGRDFWEHAGQDQKLNQIFNEAMASDTRFLCTMVTKNCKNIFMGLQSIVDVGGGTGMMARELANAFPPLKCTVLDLPQVVDGLKDSENVSYIGGNAFEAIPPVDAVLLKSILHDWSDEECVKLLKKCKEAIPSREKGGKVIIIDVVMKEEKQHKNKADAETHLFMDMVMMTLVTGKERNEEEFAKLFSEAGFNGYKISPILGLRSLIELYYY